MEPQRRAQLTPDRLSPSPLHVTRLRNLVREALGLDAKTEVDLREVLSPFTGTFVTEVAVPNYPVWTFDQSIAELPPQMLAREIRAYPKGSKNER